MTTAQELIEALRTLNPSEDAMFVVDENVEAITGYNRSQMLRGKQSEGSPIGVYAWISYAKMKQGMNPLADGAVDLKLTGSFQGKMFTKTQGNEWETSSTDSKLGELVEHYGDEVFGLTEENQAQFNKYVFLPEYLKFIEYKTGLKAG